MNGVHALTMRWIKDFVKMEAREEEEEKKTEKPMTSKHGTISLRCKLNPK